MSFPDLPSQPGAYALHLRLSQTERIVIGRLGSILFPAGAYIYCGSALGPGGLRARLGRHLAGGAHTRWHIDYLRARTDVIAVAWALCSRSAPPPRLECRLSQALAALPGASIPAPGFGAGDCRLGCAAHLVAFPPGIQPLNRLIQIAGYSELSTDILP